ncbi:MAG: DUF4389 domain-containing protein, partial [Hyphomicrobiaceae bacterium]
MESNEKTNERSPPEANKTNIWTRGLIMIVFTFAIGVGHGLLYLIAIAQFLWLLFTKAPNTVLVDFGKSLALWLADVVRFVCCATDEKPFPWSG